MADLNVIVLIGRLTADPELKYTPSNVPVSTFAIATSRTYAKEKKTDFIDIVAWRQTAEFVSKYFKKGSQIAIEGTLQTRSYTDNQGNKRKAYEVVAAQVHFVGDKKPSTQSVDVDETSDFMEIEPDEDIPF